MRRAIANAQLLVSCQFSSNDKAAEISKFFETRTTARFEKLKQSLEMVRINARWAEGIRSEPGLAQTLLVGFAVMVDKKNAFLVIFVNLEDKPSGVLGFGYLSASACKAAMATLVGLFMRYYSSSLLVDWEAEADPAYGDYAVLPILAAFFPALRFLLDRFVFEFSSNDKAAEISKFFATRTTPQFERTLKQSLEVGRINARWVEGIKSEPGLAQTVRELLGKP
ncbi:hypothetical protein QYE76_069134 [Lolium multiflorum]|uniref:Uncharacterized protein n=1 Tax=Lolium multiflorum TaxID=4521 RepID=A0AAD8SG72_LOLMU|nr:hypothetical protein QYE76_069134 [Lolium multiflorum]